MNKKQKSYKKINIILFCFFIIGLFLLGLLIYLLSPVNKENKTVEIVVEEGMSLNEIGSSLKKEGLIKSDKFFFIYTVLTNQKNIYAAKYRLNDSMSLKEIVKSLRNNGVSANEVTLTFREGITMRGLAKEISDKTNISYDEVLEKTKDTKYLNSIIKEYWFLTNDIKNKNIYYPLEGYLFPDTYYVDKENMTVEDIFKLMLDNMNEHLTKYKKQIENSKYSIHELITLASVTQSEGYTTNDFKNIASVFYNRMENNMALGSCVTSYYGVKKDMTDELLDSDINDKNAYNTRGENPSLFPVGPISLPGMEAIISVLDPIDTDYYYFVSDKNHKLYFTKNINEHEQMINSLQSKGLWLEW